MTREQLLSALRKYARKRNLTLEVDKKKGAGSHYRVKLNGTVSTLQDKLNPGRIQRFLKQIGVDPADL
jgi:hypothetical protein